MTILNIPPVFVDAEVNPPAPESITRKLPAEALAVGDAVVLHGIVWRVKSRRTLSKSPRIVFTLHPCAGGRPHSASFFPRQWLPAAPQPVKSGEKS